MTQKTTGASPAFPTNNNGTGMELRDYFAAKAIEGFSTHQNEPNAGQEHTELHAWLAYQMADAMLKARQA